MSLICLDLKDEIHSKIIITINEELKQYNLRLTERPQIIVANKMDMPDAEENLRLFKEKLDEMMQ